MTDKVQKIREEVERLMTELIQEKEKGYGSDTDDACILELQNVLTYIDSLQEESISNDLEDEAEMFASSYSVDEINEAPYAAVKQAFEFGAEWQKEQTIEWLEENLAKEISVIGNGNVTIKFRGVIEAYKKSNGG